ncbi:unnamed protein product [Macrosiphum euphorbiae]|uniref:Uncharacterized protein n=1 Tax=Macrosiphum euphorbiae TaxID=13131 RepID=A0AAV0VK50_9HEMI|nr:unnamed protein product [Macrosiphum euphorbiae]
MFKSTKKTKDPTKNRAVSDTAKVSEKTIIKNESSTVVPKQMFSSRVANEQPLNVSGKGRSSTPQTTKKTLVKGVVSRQAAESSSTASISKSLSSSSIKKTTTGKSIKTITTVDQDGNIHTTVETVDDIPQSTTETTTEESNTADSANEYVEYADQYSFEGAIETSEGLTSPGYSTSNRLTSSQNFENESSSVDQSMSTETNYNTVTSHVSSESKQLLDVKDTIQHENTVRSVNGKLIKSIDVTSRDNSNYSYPPNIRGQVDFTDTTINTNKNSSENKSSSATELDEIKNFNHGRNHQQINNESIELKSSANIFNLLSDTKEKASTSRDHENKISKDNVDNQDISSGLTVKMVGGKLIKQFNTPSTSKQSRNIVNTKEADITYNVDSNKQQYQNNVRTSFESDIIDQNVSTDKSNDYNSEMFITQKYIPIFSRSNQEIDEITSSSNENSKSFYEKTNKIDDPRYQINTEYNTKDLFGKNKNVDNDGLTVRMVGGKLIKSFKEPIKTPKIVSNILTSSNTSNSDISSGDITTSTSFITNEQSSISNSFGETNKSNSKTSSSVYQTADEQDTFKNQKQPDLKNSKLKNEKFVDNVDDESLKVRVVGGKLIKTFNEPTISKKNIVDVSKLSNISSDISSSDITTSTSFSTNEQTSVSSSFAENDHSNFNTSRSMYQSVDRPDETKHIQRPDTKKEKSKPNKSVENVDEEGLTVRVVGGKLIKTFNDPTTYKQNNTDISKSSNISTSDISSSNTTTSTSFSTNELTSVTNSHVERDQSNINDSKSLYQTSDRPYETKNQKHLNSKEDKSKQKNAGKNVDQEGSTVRMVGGKLIKKFNEPTPSKKNSFDVSKSSNISSSDISSGDITTSTSFITNEQSSLSNSFGETDQSSINTSKTSKSKNEKTDDFKNKKQPESKKEMSQPITKVDIVEEEGLSVRMVGGKLIKTFKEPTPSKKNNINVSKSSNISTSDISSSDISTSTSFSTNEQSSLSGTFEERDQSNIKATKYLYQSSDRSHETKNAKSADPKKDKSIPNKSIENFDEEGLSVRMVGGKLIKTFKEPTPTKKNTTDMSKSTNILTSDISSSDISTSTSFMTNEQSSFSSSFGETDQSSTNASKTSKSENKKTDDSKNKKQPEIKKDLSKPITTVDIVDEEGLSVRMVGGKLIKTFKEPTPTKKNTTDMSKSTNILTSDISSSDISTTTSFITNEQSSFSSSFRETDQSSTNALKTSKSENKKTDDSKNKKKPEVKKDLSKPITTVDIVDEEGLSVRMVGGKLIKTFKEPTPTKKNTTDMPKSTNILTSDISSSDISTTTSFITNEQSSFSSSFGETDQSSTNALKTSKSENKKTDDSKNKKQPDVKKDLSKPITTVDIVGEEGLSVRMVGGKLIKTFKEPTPTKKNTTDMSKSSDISTYDVSSSGIKSSTSYSTNERTSVSSSTVETDQSNLKTFNSVHKTGRPDEINNKKHPDAKTEKSKPNKPVVNVDEEGLSVHMVGGKLIKTFIEPTLPKNNIIEISKSSNSNNVTSDISSNEVTTSSSFITNEQSSFSSSLEKSDQSDIKTLTKSKSVNKNTDQLDEPKYKKQPILNKDKSKPISTVNIVDEEGLSVRMVGGKLIKNFKEPTPTKKTITDVSKSSDISTYDISSSGITTSTSFSTNEQTSVSSSIGETDQSNLKTFNSVYRIDRPDEINNKKQPDVKEEKSKPNKPIETVDEEGLSVRMVGGKLIKTFKEPTPTKKNTTDMSKSTNILTSDILSSDISTTTSFITNEQTSVSSSIGETDQSNLKTFNSVYRIDRPDEINNKKQPDVKEEKSKPNKPIETVDEEGLSVRMVGGKLIKTFKEPTPTKKNTTDMSKSTNILTSDISSSDISTTTSFITNEQTSVSSSTGETDQSKLKTFNSVYRIDRPDEINNKKLPDAKKEKSKPNKPVEKVDEEGLSVRMVGGKLIKTFKEPTPSKKNTTDVLKSSNILTSDISSSDITTSTSFTTNEQTSVSSSYVESDQSNLKISKTSNPTNQKTDRPDVTKIKKRPEAKIDKPKPKTTVDNVDEEGLSVRMVGGKLIKTFKEPSRNVVKNTSKSNTSNTNLNSQRTNVNLDSSSQVLNTTYIIDESSSNNEVIKTVKTSNDSSTTIVDGKTVKSYKGPERSPRKPKSDVPNKTNADVMPFDNNYITSLNDTKHVHDVFYDVSEESYIESRKFSEQSIVQDFQVTSNTSEYYPERPARNRDVRDNIVVQDITDFVSVSNHAEVIENIKTSEVVFEKSVVKGMTENYENRVSSSKKVQENKVDKKPRHQKEITATPKEQCICEICTCG